MKVVIQCAGTKSIAAGTMKTRDGRAVLFVANPDDAPATRDRIYARPDDRADDGRCWRDQVVGYNREPGGNPLGLLPASQLYRHACYGMLVERFGVKNVFILSAGWGLIRGDFLTPDYDITFSTSAEPFKRRRKSDPYADLNMLEARGTEPVAFFGGKDYLPLFCELTQTYAGPRTAAFRTEQKPQAPGVQLVRYSTRTRTNWHYEAVAAFLAGSFSF